MTFDLAGDNRPERWPWVRPDTGILVWDPEETGKIGSGRQLFGSYTWMIFWKHGFEPLAALDDDADGRLAGSEVNGLAAWQDRNGNAVSERGKVRPLLRLGITQVATRPAGQSVALCHPQGLLRADGTSLPTYDWTPRSLGRPATRR